MQAMLPTLRYLLDPTGCLQHPLALVWHLDACSPGTALFMQGLMYYKRLGKARVNMQLHGTA